jgi:Peptidase family M23
MKRLDWWLYPVWGLAILQAAFFLVPQTRPGLLGAVCWLFGMDRLLWPGLAALLLLCGLAWSAWRRPFWNRRRAAGFLLLLALTASPLAFRTYPSSHDHSPSQVRFRLPLNGPLTVAWGGATPLINYHVSYPDQRWAYDLLVTRNGKSHKENGQDVHDYYCYGLPVLAPAEGTIETTSDGNPDMPIGVLSGGLHPCGNHIVIQVAPREFLFLCHLQPGSIHVKKGDRVTAGQALARVGNSGNTSEPHLHIHLQDSPMEIFAEGIPLCFHNYRVGEEVVERGIPTGGFTGDRLTGQLVEHVPVLPRR